MEKYKAPELSDTLRMDILSEKGKFTQPNSIWDDVAWLKNKFPTKGLSLRESIDLDAHLKTFIERSLIGIGGVEDMRRYIHTYLPFNRRFKVALENWVIKGEVTGFTYPEDNYSSELWTITDYLTFNRCEFLSASSIASKLKKILLADGKEPQTIVWEDTGQTVKVYPNDLLFQVIDPIRAEHPWANLKPKHLS